MVIGLAVVTYLLFNAVLTMLILEDNPIEHKRITTILLVLFCLPLLIITIVIAIIIAMIEAIGGLLK